MSTGAIVAIAVGGSVVLVTPIVWLIVWFTRRQAAAAKVAIGKLRDELPRRGDLRRARRHVRRAVQPAV